MRYALTLVFLLPIAVLAQNAPPTADDQAKAARAETARKLAKDLTNPDVAVQNAAMEQIKSLLLAELGPGQQGALTIPLWHRSLLKVKRYDDAEWMTHTRILTIPWNGPQVATMQRLRAEAFLAAGKHDAALSAAKGYYNVNRVRETPAAVELIAKCLAAARPGDKEVVQRLRLQQAGGATTQPSENVLAGIKVDTKAFDEAVGLLIDDDYATFMAKGNLLLLCDRPAEARAAFDAALVKAGDDNQKLQVHLGIARTIKAATRSVDAANAYLDQQKVSEP